MRSLARKILSRFAAVAMSTLMMLFLLEVIVRWIPGAPATRLPKPLFMTGYKTANSLQYHDYEYPQQKGPDEFRILVLGDSFSEGTSVDFEDTYPKRLERYLNYSGNKNGVIYQVINLSKGGRSTPLEAKLIKRYVRYFNPDMVMLGYCLNDAEDSDNAASLLHLREECYYYHFQKPDGWGGFLYNHSAVARLIFRRIFAYNSHRGYKRYYQKLYESNYSGWQKCQEALSELGNFSRSSNMPLVVLIFPLFSFDIGDDYPFADIHASIRNVLKKAGLPCIDLLSHYKNIDHIQLEVYPEVDPHPSEIAHRIAAEVIFKRMAKRGMLGPIMKKRGRSAIFPDGPAHYDPLLLRSQQNNDLSPP